MGLSAEQLSHQILVVVHNVAREYDISPGKIFVTSSEENPYIEPQQVTYNFIMGRVPTTEADSVSRVLNLPSTQSLHDAVEFCKNIQNKAFPQLDDSQKILFARINRIDKELRKTL